MNGNSQVIIYNLILLSYNDDLYSKKKKKKPKNPQVAREAMKESKTLSILLPLTAVFLAF